MIKFNIVKRLYHSFFILMISIIFLFLFPFNIVEISYGQSMTFETESETAVTSYIDALFKAPILISQALVVGVSFVHSFLFIHIMKKEPIFFNNNENFFLFGLFNNKLFVLIIIICGSTILNMSIILFSFQASLLSLELGVDITYTFIILFTSSSGNIFVIKLLTSAFTIALAILYHYLNKRLYLKTLKLVQEKEQQRQQNSKLKLQIIKTSLTFCITLLIVGSINIFSNSISDYFLNVFVTKRRYIYLGVIEPFLFLFIIYSNFFKKLFLTTIIFDNGYLLYHTNCQ